MSDNLRRAREIQRAKTAERVTRDAAAMMMRHLAAALVLAGTREFVQNSIDGLTCSDGLNDAVDFGDFDIELGEAMTRLQFAIGEARAACEKHAHAYATLASLEGPVQP